MVFQMYVFPIIDLIKISSFYLFPLMVTLHPSFLLCPIPHIKFIGKKFNTIFLGTIP